MRSSLIFPQNVAGTPTALQRTASQVPVLSMSAVAVSPLFVSLSQASQNVTLQWFGTAVLQSSSDLKNWKDVTGAAASYTAPTGGPSKFYRLVFRP